jgi:hypothetical protein
MDSKADEPLDLRSTSQTDLGFSQSEKEFLLSIGIEFDDRGFFVSGSTCEQCGGKTWVKVTTKPAHWESDINITRFDYECRACNVRFTEYDSD